MIKNILILTFGCLFSFILSCLIDLFIENNYSFDLSKIYFEKIFSSQYAIIFGVFFMSWFIYVISEILLIKYNKKIQKEFAHKLDRNSIKIVNVKCDNKEDFQDDIGYIWNNALIDWLVNQEHNKISKLRIFLFYALFSSTLIFLSLGSYYVIKNSKLDIEILTKFKGLSLGSPLTLFMLTVSLLEIALFVWILIGYKFPEKNKQRCNTKGVCLLIACHKSCYNTERSKNFQQTLKSAMEIFPPESIFICDNGPAKIPADDTQKIAYKIDKNINYAYVPIGNKTNALYWTTEYWMPHLHRWGIIENFEHCVMIDDDVWLPKDMNLEVKNMDEDTYGFGYGITAVDSNGEQNLLVELQDIEYKMAGLFKYFQSEKHSIAWAHGAISMWRRDVLGKKIFYEHDTVFHGEDMYMGVLLQKHMPHKKLKYNVNTLIPTFVPSDLLTLTRQRIKSWDLCNQRKFFTFCSLFFSLKNFYLKPFYILEIVNIIFDWTRPFMIIVGGVFYPLYTILSFISYILLTFVMLFLFSVVGCYNRPEFKPTIRSMIIFPFYKIYLGLLRFIALMHNAVWYAPFFPAGNPISKKEILPVPPYPLPNWQTIYFVEENMNIPESIIGIREIFDTERKPKMELLIMAYIEFSRMTRYLKSKSVKKDIINTLGSSEKKELFRHLKIVEKSLYEMLIEQLPQTRLMFDSKFNGLIDHIVLKTPKEKSNDIMYYQKIFIRYMNNVCFYIWQIHSPVSHDNMLSLKQKLMFKDRFIKKMLNTKKCYEEMKKYAKTLRGDK